MAVLEADTIPAAVIESNVIPVSRNPFTINENISPFLSLSSSGLAVRHSVCLISPRVCLLGFVPDRVFFLQCDSSVCFASTARSPSHLLKSKHLLLSTFLTAY